MAAINKSTIDISETALNENRQYLNWPGLQYLFYAKIKPMIKNTVGQAKNMYDDENWYISYDICTGEVYLVSADDNQIFYFDSADGCGTLVEGKVNAGMLQIRIDREKSAIVEGFIDERYGTIGPDGYKSDEIGFATGKLYVDFDRGGRISTTVEDGHNAALINRRIDQIREDLDSHVKIQSITTGGGYTSEQISNPEYQTVVIDASGHILESVDNDDNVFIADILDGEENIEGFIDYNEFVNTRGTEENPEFSRAITDNDERLLYGLRNDNTEYTPEVNLKNYRIDNVSVKKIVRNLKKIGPDDSTSETTEDNQEETNNTQEEER